jgi:hypothetical protein
MNRAVLSLTLWLVIIPSLGQGTIHLANRCIKWYQLPSDSPFNLDGLILGATNAVYVTGPLQTNATFWVTLSNSAGAVGRE